MSSALSLKAQALALLARRDYSREELARKLSAHACRVQTRASHPTAGKTDEYPDEGSAEDASQIAEHTTAEITALLDELERENWLSNSRFAQSFSRRRGNGRGTALVLHDLRQHKLDETDMQAVREQLQATEVQRARQAWEKKFGQAPANAKDWARQARFMMSRGFSASTFKQVLAEFKDSPDYSAPEMD